MAPASPGSWQHRQETHCAHQPLCPVQLPLCCSHSCVMCVCVCVCVLRVRCVLCGFVTLVHTRPVSTQDMAPSHPKVPRPPFCSLRLSLLRSAATLETPARSPHSVILSRPWAFSQMEPPLCPAFWDKAFAQSISVRSLSVLSDVSAAFPFAVVFP